MRRTECPDGDAREALALLLPLLRSLVHEGLSHDTEANPASSASKGGFRHPRTAVRVHAPGGRAQIAMAESGSTLLHAGYAGRHARMDVARVARVLRNSCGTGKAWEVIPNLFQLGAERSLTA